VHRSSLLCKKRQNCLRSKAATCSRNTDRKLSAGRNVRQRFRQTIRAPVCAARVDPDGPARYRPPQSCSAALPATRLRARRIERKITAARKGFGPRGFDAQVKVTSRVHYCFIWAGGVRQVITASTGKFQAGEKTWARDELVHMTHTEPENFSPNALFRPVVQDYLLPTAAYIAGPAEISYFAQSEVVYRHLLGRMPVIAATRGIHAG